MRKSSGPERFGFYKAAADRPALRPEYDRFPFKPFLDREFTVVSIKGLTHDEGNRQIQVETKNAEGAGSVSSKWRRHAKLILTVPKCQGVGVKGALGGFRVHSLKAPLMVQGGGDRDYQARYVVANLEGPFTASDIPIHQIDGVKGDVSILATAYAEDTQTSHGPDGVTMRPVAPPDSTYKDIQGNLHARFCRATLTLEGIAGRVDVENAFGKTIWRADRPLAAMDHRIVSQSGPIEVRFSPGAPGKLPLALFTECGAIRLPRGNSGLESRMFHGSMGDTTSRSWHGFLSGQGENRLGDISALFERIPAAVRGDRRAAGDRHHQPGGDRHLRADRRRCGGSIGWPRRVHAPVIDIPPGDGASGPRCRGAPADLNATIAGDPVQEEMTRVTHLPYRHAHMIAAVPEMVRPGGVCDFGTCMAARALGLGGDVEDGPRQKGFVADPAPFAEVFVGPFEDRLDISLGAWQQPILGHRFIHSPHADRSVRPAHLPIRWIKSASASSPSITMASPRSSSSNASVANLRSTVSFASSSWIRSSSSADRPA